MPKKFFISIILFMFLALSVFSYYFYSSHSLKSQNPNKTFNPKKFSEQVLDRTIILAPHSLMYRFMKNTCNINKNKGLDENMNLEFNNTSYSKIDFKYRTKVVKNFFTVLDEYYTLESLQDSKDSIVYKQRFSFEPNNEFFIVELRKTDKSFVVNQEKVIPIKELCESFKTKYNEDLSKITNLTSEEQKNTITIEGEHFKTSYVKFGLDVNTLNPNDRSKFYVENWTAIEKELNDFSIKTINHTNEHDTTVQLIYYKFDKNN